MLSAISKTNTCNSILCMVLLVTGCASLMSNTQLPVADKQIEVPIILQRNSKQCGLAALSMVTRYYGRELPDEKFQSLSILADKQNGLSGANLVQALRENGYYVALLRGTVDDNVTGLRYNIDRGRPLIVMLEEGTGSSTLQHYVVLAGYYINSGDWLIVDPQWGKRAIKADKFLAEWAAAGNFTLLSMPENSRQAN